MGPGASAVAGSLAEGVEFEISRTQYSFTNTMKHLEALNSMLRVARSAGIVDTVPSDGVKPTRQRTKFVDATRKLPFKPQHVRTIFRKAGQESEDFRWMVKLLAYHGARSGELAQLRVDDVMTMAGVAILSIHDRYGSVKNKHSVRHVPIHPKCIGIVDYARTRNGEWLFGSFLEWKGKRGEFFQRRAHDFLRATCKITAPEYTMHSFRHLWRTLAREIGMPEAVSRAIMGHSLGKDDHAAYGEVPSLKVRAEWIGKIDPLA